MGTFGKLTWVELKLFAREPFAVFFTVVFPLVVLIVLNGSFTPADADAFGGNLPSDYYLASYVGVVIGAVGLIAVPVHVATYWERGILRRFRASAVSTWSVFGAQLAVGLLMVALSSVVLVIAARLLYDAQLPDSLAGVLASFVVGAVSFLTLGLLLAVLTRNARAAQALGMILFFPMWLLSGAGPPPDVMSSGMNAVSDALPLTYVVRALQDPWLGAGFNTTNILLLGAMLVIAGGIGIRLARSA